MKQNNHLYYSLAPSWGKGARRAGKGFLFFALLLSTLLFQSCLKDQEDIFDKSSSLRMQEVLDKTKAALTGNENGWSLAQATRMAGLSTTTQTVILPTVA